MFFLVPIFAYNLSPQLVDLIHRAENLRRQLLLTPISPKVELRLRWEKELDRVYWSLVLSGNALSKGEIINLLSHPKQGRLKPESGDVINYKKALDWLKNEWLVTGKPVNLASLTNLANIALKSLPERNFKSPQSKEEIVRLLTFLETSSEHPIVQAGIAQIQLINLSPFLDGNGRIARLASYLFLYKNGYDFRGMLVLDEYFRNDLVTLRGAIESASKTKNMTLWLEYFSVGVVKQLEKALEDIANARFKTDLPASFWSLNDRQKAILEILSRPEEKITNAQAQKLFQITQITASRDLSKLVKLGLLFSQGRGRATFYTKV